MHKNLSSIKFKRGKRPVGRPQKIGGALSKTVRRTLEEPTYTMTGHETEVVEELALPVVPVPVTLTTVPVPVPLLRTPSVILRTPSSVVRNLVRNLPPVVEEVVGLLNVEDSSLPSAPLQVLCDVQPPGTLPSVPLPVPGPSCIYFPAQGSDSRKLRSSVRSVSDSSKSPRITRSISAKRLKPY